MVSGWGSSSNYETFFISLRNRSTLIFLLHLFDSMPNVTQSVDVSDRSVISNVVLNSCLSRLMRFSVLFDVNDIFTNAQALFSVPTMTCNAAFGLLEKCTANHRSAKSSLLFFNENLMISKFHSQADPLMF